MYTLFCYIIVLILGRPTETTTEICHDHSNCDYLVQQLGICNDSYGLQMCPVACGKCIIPTTYSCIDTDTECSYLRDTYNICAVPDTSRKTGCLKTCNYCGNNIFFFMFLLSLTFM